MRPASGRRRDPSCRPQPRARRPRRRGKYRRHRTLATAARPCPPRSRAATCRAREGPSCEHVGREFEFEVESPVRLVLKLRAHVRRVHAPGDIVAQALAPARRCAREADGRGQDARGVVTRISARSNVTAPPRSRERIAWPGRPDAGGHAARVDDRRATFMRTYTPPWPHAIASSRPSWSRSASARSAPSAPNSSGGPNSPSTRPARHTTRPWWSQPPVEAAVAGDVAEADLRGRRSPRPARRAIATPRRSRGGARCPHRARSIRSGFA